MSKILFRIGDLLRAVLATLVAIALFLIVVLVFYQVITRYFTGTATPQLAEFARFLFIWLVFAGSAWLVSRGDLIAIDFFSVQMGPQAKRVQMIFVEICTAALMVALLIYSQKLLDVVAIKRAPATGIPYGWVYLALPTFCVAGLYFILERAVKTRLFAAITADSGKRA
ncbi:TRAP transporter small permease [Pseudomonas sp. GX19020]|uniref:TRAP transporter small permease n=1 Tax=Pseudomonas sp. GX19020 TaxID=2942277 RepID=UPI0020186A01|nr:TRAP transporter small permease [Pseudomonas sp. GX19020]MCL4067577.1 TRAP transporter small permease [Pseudomonas sp. GX19020]